MDARVLYAEEPMEDSFDAAVEEYLKLSDSLMGELNYLRENNTDESNQFWRRSFIRASWSLVDGEIYALKKMCRSIAPLRCEAIRESDKNFLSNERQNTGDKIKRVLKIAKQLFDLSVTLNFGGS